jgi:amidophosphoribosyltransferase
VFGVYAPGRDVARLAYFALYALQHRGQESAGIATCEGGHITTLRETGLVSQVFDEQKLQALDGDMAIGHVRYSTTGGGSWENTQPVWRDDGREVALAHNGNLTSCASRASASAVPPTRRSSRRCSRSTRRARSRTRWPR